MLTGIVLVKNEASNLGKCLPGLAFCDHILVIDDNSTDDSVKVAQRYGAEIMPHPLNGDFAAARNWALKQAKTPWVLFVDADEIVSPKLATEIQTAIQKIEFKGFAIRRLDALWGQTLNHGDVGDVWLVRLARRGAGSWKGPVHETWQIEAQVGRLKQPLLHYPHPDLVSFLERINHYSTLKADYFFKQNKKVGLLEIIGGPVWRFKKNYLLKFGFLDGTAGFVHAMLMAFYTFMVAGKLYLRYKGIGDEQK